MLDAEMLGIPYRDMVSRLDRLSRINKQQVIEFVRAWYGENYVVVYKRTGADENVVKVVKPTITPVSTNREKQSDFVKDMTSRSVDVLNPVFLDFNKDIKRSSLKGKVPVYMTTNKENELFVLTYSVQTGSSQDKRWPVVMQLLNFMGTDRFSSSVLQEEFYKLGCSFSGSASEDELRVTLSGLQKHFYDATSLLENILLNPQVGQEALDNLVTDILKRRADARLNKGEVLARLTAYARYGKVNPYTFQISQSDLKALTAKELLALLRNFNGMEHRVDYYGPADSASVVQTLTKLHRLPRGLQAVKTPNVFVEQPTGDSAVFFVHYDMKQAELNFLAKGQAFDQKIQPVVQMYNRYFSGGMSSPVFQTMRESRALAYSVSSRYSVPNRPDRSFYNTAYIGTQADKLPEALSGMFGLLNDMPISEQNFNQSKEGVLQSIRSERLTKNEILSTYHAMKRMGADHDWREDQFNSAFNMKLDDVVQFQKKYLKDNTYRIALIGDREKIDFSTLGKFGKVSELSMDDIFED
jgi:predicted Zn-dependent peptidase